MTENSEHLLGPFIESLKSQRQQVKEPKRPRRVALYARVSTGQSARGLEYQLQCLRAAAEVLDMEVALEVTEIASDAAAIMPKRDALAEQSGKMGLDAIMVTHRGKFGHTLKGLFNTWGTLNRAKVAFISLFEGIDDSTPHGFLVGSLLATIAEHERDSIDQWIAAGFKRAVPRGAKFGRPIIRYDYVEKKIAKALRKNKRQWHFAGLYKICHSAVSAIGQKIKRQQQLWAARLLGCLQPRDHRGNTEKCRPRSAGADAARAQPQASQLL